MLDLSVAELIKIDSGRKRDEVDDDIVDDAVDDKVDLTNDGVGIDMIKTVDISSHLHVVIVDCAYVLHGVE